MIGCGEKGEYVSGGITVFLTLIFGIVLALFTVTIENVRILTGDSYVRIAAEAASLAAFGEYNRELYAEYGLFGYGGYDGKNSQELSENIAGNLECALDAAASDTAEKRMDIYRITEPHCSITKVQAVTDKEPFYQQIEDYVTVHAIKDVSQKLIGQYNKKKETMDSQSLSKQLDRTDAYERGEYDEKQAAAEEKRSNNTTAEADEVTGSDEKTDTKETTAQKDKAGGNPLDTFCHLMRDGILNLVCDVDSLADGGEQEGIDGSAAEILKGLLFNQLDASSLSVQSGKQKGELICYGNAVFSSYITDRHRATRYGMEYLATGKEEERDCLSGVVNRLFLIRLPLNYAYVNCDKELKAEALATATAIAGALELPPLITAIQQTILLILSVEESLVDITALLQGRSVPFVKNKGSFQIKYREICTAGKALFAQKAKNFTCSTGRFTQGSFDYGNYLWLFLLMVSEETLRERTCALIQYDLRERFNQTFTISQCIYGVNVSVDYTQPLLWGNLYGGSTVKGRSVELWHQYG